MTILIADVGGTNSRLALAGPDGVPDHPVHFPNRDYASFYKVIEAFADSRDMSGVAAVCIAVAGPVTSSSARLTNRDWLIESDAVAEMLVTRPRVALVNDLAALGHALPGLGKDQLTMIKPAADTRPSNGQSLVAGLGTGFNVCLVKETGSGICVIEAELGHASLPSRLEDVLAAEIGAQAADNFPTTEDLFSGRGLVRLHQAISGDELTSQDIVEQAGTGNTAAVRSVELLARCLSLLSKQMVFQYMPLGGIHFAGSVARGIFETRARAVLAEGFEDTGPFGHLIAQVPLRLITDDAAALTGLARLGRSMLDQRPTA